MVIAESNTGVGVSAPQRHGSPEKQVKAVICRDETDREYLRCQPNGWRKTLINILSLTSKVRYLLFGILFIQPSNIRKIRIFK